MVPQVALSIAWTRAQAVAELVESLTGDAGGPLLPQPCGKQSAACRVIEATHGLAIESCSMDQALQRQVAESGLGVPDLEKAFAEVCHALFASGMQLVQDRHHLVPKPRVRHPDQPG